MAIRLVELSFDKNMIFVLIDYFYVLDFKQNLVSISCLIKHGLTVQFNFSISIGSKSSFIWSGTLLNDLFFLSLKFYDTNAIESVNNDDEHVQLWKKKKVSN